MVKPSGQTAADTKARILDAADAVFVRRGIDDDFCNLLTWGSGHHEVAELRAVRTRQ